MIFTTLSGALAVDEQALVADPIHIAVGALHAEHTTTKGAPHE
jgi:hypothetical protein